MITQRQLFLQHVAQTSPSPLALEIDRAEGIYLFDVQGKRYVDFISGIGVSNVGHRHPKVVAAIKDQLDKYMHLMVYGEYIQSPQVKLATKLASLLSPALNTSYFVNSGTEATEGALKLAKRYTGRSEIIYFNNAYHGSTHGALSVMGSDYFRQAYRPLLPDTKMLEYGKLADLENVSTKTACVIIETVQGESGAIVPSQEFMSALRKRCNETGTLLILDEVQCAFGRTGKMFAFEHFNVVPDILTIAKGLGGGMPIGAFISSQEIMQSLTQNPVLGHITTFGGHPVSCAAALACVEAIEEEQLIAQVAQKEKIIRDLLQHPAIKAIHGKGLMLSVEFETAEKNMAIINNCIKNGVITDWFLFADHKMRIAPPLTITEEELKTACKLILKSIDEV